MDNVYSPLNALSLMPNNRRLEIADDEAADFHDFIENIVNKIP